ncbi:MAG: DUF1993 domain-containing protein [Rhizobiales bacterium]|nr:DUF1993 domain-containing protein [Hyphomicrobiales bacterium]
MARQTNTEATYSFTIPVFIRTLRNVERLLAIAERHARRNKIDPAILLQARLYPDMYSLLQQVQYACFIPVDFARHFTDTPPPRVGYDEVSFVDLKASLKQTIAYLRAITPKQFAGHWAPLLPLFFDSTRGLDPEAHASRLTVPDFFFHVTVAYAILRHNGVALGKSDFLGPLDAVPMKRGKA